ncbi:MAG: inositol 2-dehydrogenase [Chloroflexi bacterium]|nr:inositol 2-dehydrogenase [Chloroflexota bacterium]
MTIRIGLIGSGRMGEVFAHHLAYSIAEADFVAVADVNHETAKRVASRYGAKRHYGDYAELLSQKDIDAVVIATPTKTHEKVVVDAANAGKHIFSEKPLALTLQGCDTALTAVKAAGVKLQVGFMRRYDPAYLAAKQKIDAGVIGTPVMFKSIGRDPKRTSLEFAHRVNSGGLIMDMGVHDFDLARWLMDSEVKRVFSEGGCLVFPELNDVNDIDNAVISLKFENGAVGAVDLSRNAVYGYDVRTEVMGSEGSLYIGKEQQTPLWVKTRAGITHDTVPYFMERFAEAYAAEIKDFVACLEDDREPTVSGYDGRKATAIGIAATISFDEGRPVELGELE